jgi:hypothetical protein
MGLAISVGNPFLGDDEGEQRYRLRMEGLRDALAGRGVEWSEPDTVPPPSAMRKHISSFPYRYLHYLRRAYALDYLGIPVTPAASYDEVQRADHQIEDATLGLSSHLLCHADQSGYYVPAEFDDPLFLDESIDGAGMVGSSPGLLDELQRVAPLIGVELADGDELPDAEAARLFGSDVDEANPFGIEQTVWLTLHEACRASIAHGNAVVFH